MESSAQETNILQRKQKHQKTGDPNSTKGQPTEEASINENLHQRQDNLDATPLPRIDEEPSLSHKAVFRDPDPLPLLPRRVRPRVEPNQVQPTGDHPPEFSERRPNMENSPQVADLVQAIAQPAPESQEQIGNYQDSANQPRNREIDILPPMISLVNNKLFNKPNITLWAHLVWMTTLAVAIVVILFRQDFDPRWIITVYWMESLLDLIILVNHLYSPLTDGGRVAIPIFFRALTMGMATWTYFPRRVPRYSSQWRW